MSMCSLTAFVERERDGFVSLCPELDIASQGRTVEEASANLREAVELFFECADAQEVSVFESLKDKKTGTMCVEFLDYDELSERHTLASRMKHIVNLA